MAQIKEKFENTKKEVNGLKEMIVNLNKSIEKLIEEVRENTSVKKKNESTISSGPRLKLKGKLADEAKSTQGAGTGDLIRANTND